MGVSKNSGTPKSSTLIGFSIINHPFWGTPIFGNIHIYLEKNSSLYKQLLGMFRMVFQCMAEFLDETFLTPDAPRLMKASSLQIDCLGILVRCFSFQNAPKKHTRFVSV